MQLRVRDLQQVGRAFRRGECGAGGGLAETVGQTVRVDAQRRGAVGDGLLAHGIHKGVLVTVGGVRAKVVHAFGHSRVIGVLFGGVAVRHALGCQIGLQLVGCRLDVLVVVSAPVVAVCHFAVDAAAHDVERIVHAEHDAVVARFGGACQDLWSKLWQHACQSHAPGVCAGGVAGREGTGTDQPVVFGGMRVALGVSPVGDAHDVLVDVRDVVLAAIGAILERTRMLEVLLGGRGGDCIVLEDVRDLLQAAVGQTGGKIFAEHRAQGVRQGLIGAHIRVHQSALLLCGSGRAVSVFGGGVVDLLDVGVIVIEHGLVEHLAASGFGGRLPVAVIFAKQLHKIRLGRTRLRNGCIAGDVIRVDRGFVTAFGGGRVLGFTERIRGAAGGDAADTDRGRCRYGFICRSRRGRNRNAGQRRCGDECGDHPRREPDGFHCIPFLYEASGKMLFHSENLERQGGIRV